MRALFALSLLLFFVGSCGPVATKTYPTPASLQMQALKQSAEAGREQTRFTYHEKTSDCRNTLGVVGYNQDRLGPCSLIITQAQVKEILARTPKDLKDYRGSLFYRVTIPNGTRFKGYNFEGTHWIEVQGSKIQFIDSNITRSSFTKTEFK